MTEKYIALDGYLNEEGKFSRFPGKRQKNNQFLMLEYLSEQFETDRTYTEAEVNQILNNYHSFNDPATLRRLMFGHQLINRTLDGRSYWIENR